MPTNLPLRSPESAPPPYGKAPPRYPSNLFSLLIWAAAMIAVGAAGHVNALASDPTVAVMQ